MIATIANLIVTLLAVYLVAGVVFALPFVLVGAGRLDPAAHKGTGAFRVLILPGTVALWPVLAWKWVKARRKG